MDPYSLVVYNETYTSYSWDETWIGHIFLTLNVRGKTITYSSNFTMNTDKTYNYGIDDYLKTSQRSVKIQNFEIDFDFSVRRHNTCANRAKVGIGSIIGGIIVLGFLIILALAIIAAFFYLIAQIGLNLVGADRLEEKIQEHL